MVIDELLDEILGCRLLYCSLSPDILAGTDFSDREPVIKINTSVADVPMYQGADIDGVLAVSKGHEAIHIIREHGGEIRSEKWGKGQLPLPSFPILPVVLTCYRSPGEIYPDNAERRREFEAEIGCRTFMVPGWGLARQECFRELTQRARLGKQPSSKEIWFAVYGIAHGMGVNPAFMKKVLVDRGLISASGKAPNEVLSLNHQMDFGLEDW